MNESWWKQQEQIWKNPIFVDYWQDPAFRWNVFQLLNPNKWIPLLSIPFFVKCAWPAQLDLNQRQKEWEAAKCVMDMYEKTNLLMIKYSQIHSAPSFTSLKNRRNFIQFLYWEPFPATITIVPPRKCPNNPTLLLDPL